MGWLGAATLSAWAARVGSKMIWDSENTLVNLKEELIFKREELGLKKWINPKNWM
ncbi:MAG: hypothetical protein J7L26_00430 [Candidatus Aminicenantes bacterium]|nr:hypothetical protein [Candidatus Aminicenantes bacterium]